VSRNVTLNLGLRGEYESAIFDRGGSFGESTFEPNRYSRAWDPSNPIPEFQGSGQPQIPAEALALMDRPYQWSGAWNFTDENNRGMWDPRKVILLPRAGVALRLNDFTSLRIGWARYNTPSKLQRISGDILGSTLVPGFSAETPIAPNLEGVPQQRLSDPFPTDVNPVIAVVGKGDGRYTNMGQNVIYDKQDLVTGVNDRFNFSLQRETFNRILVDATYFFNLGRDLPYTLDLNLVNPAITNAQGTALSQQVANPFYQLLPQNQMRGQLRNQKTVTLGSLLKPYPHYDQVRQFSTDGVGNRYHAFQLRLQRPFANGFNFILAYNYNQERNEEFFNKEETFLNQFRWEDAVRQRHRMTLAGTYEFPFGRGRRFGTDVNKVVDALIGGWTTSWIYNYRAGERIRFNDVMNVNGDPNAIEKDKWGYMFNPDAFEFLSNANFVVRTNPKSFPGVLGPGLKEMDITLGKFYNLSERFRLELKMEAYNVTNTFTGANPVTSVTNSAFGRVTAMGAGARGREFQYNIRLHF
jgi:hypothetical protein